MIIRGTTPQLIFTVNSDIDLNEIFDVWVTIQVTPKNATKKSYTFAKDRMTIDSVERKIILTLTQDDTVKLNASSCQIQMKLKLNDESVYASDIIAEEIGKILNSEII